MAYPKTSLSIALLLVAVSIIYLWETLALQKSGMHTSGSSPIAYPLTVGVPMAVLSVVFLITVLMGFRSKSLKSSGAGNEATVEGGEEQSSSDAANAPSAIRIEAPIVMGISIVHALLLPVWGYLVGTAVFTFALALVVRGTLRPQSKQLLVTGGFAIAVSLITYLALDYGLGIRLPEGLIGLGGL